MGSPFGRPIKYKDLLNQLNQNSLFSSAGIARFGIEVGYYEGLTVDKRKKKMRQIYLALGRLAKSRNFPVFGDGIIRLDGQAPTPAWFGWRWQNAPNIQPGNNADGPVNR